MVGLVSADRDPKIVAAGRLTDAPLKEYCEKCLTANAGEGRSDAVEDIWVRDGFRR